MKKPFALVMNDSHLHKNNASLIKDIFNQAIIKCKELKINKIFHNGDFFHSREAQPLQVLLEAKEIMLNIKSNNIDHFIIPGNHDRTDLESENSYLDIFEKDCNLIKKESSLEWKEMNVIWLPYFKEKGSYISRLEKATKMIVKNKFNLLNTHIGISGVVNNDGSSVDNEIKQDLFKKFDKIFVAHYHDQQNIKNIYYTGSCVQANFGEDNIKGFTLLYEDGSHSFIKSKFPEFIKMKINVDDKDALKKFEKANANGENISRVILTGDKTKLQAFNKANLLDKGIDVKFESDELNTNIDISSQEIVVFDRSNLKEAFNKFCDLNETQDKDFGLNYLEKIL